MKLNMICSNKIIKMSKKQQLKKPRFWTVVVLSFLKPENLGSWKQKFQPWNFAVLSSTVTKSRHIFTLCRPTALNNLKVASSL